MTTPRPHRIAIEVRDHECDLQGIVNNAVYQHYLEHGRHRFLKEHGFDFAMVTRAGVHLVVVRAEVDYKAPLKSGDTAIVESTLEVVSPVRFAFLQRILREQGATRALMVQAKIICAAMDLTGKPIRPTMLEPMFAKHRVDPA